MTPPGLSNSEATTDGSEGASPTETPSPVRYIPRKPPMLGGMRTLATASRALQAQVSVAGSLAARGPVHGACRHCPGWRHRDEPTAERSTAHCSRTRQGRRLRQRRRRTARSVATQTGRWRTAARDTARNDTDTSQGPDTIPVSYTHLRAHETDSCLVC